MPEKKEIQVASGARISVSVDAAVRFSAAIYVGREKIYETDKTQIEVRKMITMDEDRITLSWILIPAENIEWSYEISISVEGRSLFKQQFSVKKGENGRGRCVLIAKKEVGSQ